MQDEVVPYDKNLFRTGEGLRSSLAELDAVWARLCSSLSADGAGVAKAREAAALAANAWSMYASALARTETRGMHRREDHPAPDPDQQHRIVTCGSRPNVSPWR